MATKKLNDRKRRERTRRKSRRRDSQAPFLYAPIEVYDAPKEVNRPAGVQELAEQAVELISRNDGAGAERLLKQALEMDPDACDLRNNLCAAYEIQGRHVEAAALVREIHNRNPHYFFGRANLANLCIIDGDVERAKRLIESLWKQGRMHTTEFSAVTAAQIHLCLAHGDVAAARGWFKIWNEAVPGDGAQKHWRRKLARTPLGWLRRWAIRPRPARRPVGKTGRPDARD